MAQDNNQPFPANVEVDDQLLPDYDTDDIVIVTGLLLFLFIMSINFYFIKIN